MSDPMKQQVEERELRYDGVHCSLRLERVSRGIVSLQISGRDVGEFSDAPLLALDRWLASSGAVELFIDARHVKGASIDVSGEWARWLGGHKDQLRSVTMLTGRDSCFKSFAKAKVERKRHRFVLDSLGTLQRTHYCRKSARRGR